MTWIAVAVLLSVSFVFSGIEAGILSVNRVRLKHRIKIGDRAALELGRLLANPERLLVTVIIVTNLMNITAITLATREFVRWFGGRGFLLALGVFLPVYLLGLELLPKSLFRRFPYRALAALAEPLKIADALLAPLHWIGWRVIRLLLGGHAPQRRKLFVGREDFKYLTIESERTGTITREERELIHNVVDFRSVIVRDVMVPMQRVRTIAPTASIADLLAKQKETKFDRWPVMSVDGDVTGMVDVFEIALEGRRRGTVEALQRRVVRVEQSEPAYAVLRKLRAARVGLAIVNGETGGAIGIVSVEDLIQRLARGNHEA